MTKDVISYAGSNILTKETLQILKNVSNAASVIEIAGPSPDGYKIFEDQNIPTPKLWVTNKFNPVTINPYGKNPIHTKVDQKVNARKLPFKENSVDAFFTSYLSVTSDLVNTYPKFYPYQIDSFILSLAIKEYSSNHKPIFNIRARFFIQALKILKPGGIIVMVGPTNQDYEYAKKLGYTILATNYPGSDKSFTAVFQKPI
jgi:hypothetical protein